MQKLDLDSLHATLFSLYETATGSTRQAVLCHAHSAMCSHLETDLEIISEAVAKLRETKIKDQRPTYVVTDSARIAGTEFQSIQSIHYRSFLNTLDDASSNIIVIFDFFEEMYRFVAALNKNSGHSLFFPTTKFSRPFADAKYAHFDQKAHATLLKMQAKFKNFDYPDAEQITQAIKFCEHIEGDYLEIGVYKGRSAFVAADYLSRQPLSTKKIYLMDTYAGFDYDAAQTSWDAGWYGGHSDQSEAAIKALLAGFPNVVTIKSNIIEDALPKEIEKLSIVNIDVDMFDAVKAALEKTCSRVSDGGVIICEDAGHRHVGGAYVAMVDFLGSSAGAKFRPLHLYSGQFLLIKDK